MRSCCFCVRRAVVPFMYMCASLNRVTVALGPVRATDPSNSSCLIRDVHEGCIVQRFVARSRRVLLPS